MTENMKFWLKNLYLSEAEEHFATARNEHLCALGSPADEAAMLHEMNADEHRMFANILKAMSNNIEDEWQIDTIRKQYDDETIEYQKKIFPDLEEHDIPYYCGTCLDEASDQKYIDMEQEMSGLECPLGGDETDDCEGCAYSCDYHFMKGECVRREEN